MTSATVPAPSTSSSQPVSPEPGQGDGNGWPGGFGLYIHWPFCLSKCPYCDFNSHVAAEVDQARWRRALLAELDAMAARTPGREVDTVFFGGGTPSLMPPETVAAIIERIGRLWRLAPDAEITLEANPTSVEAGRFRAYAAGGVNRVSMGVQSLRDDQLKALGRMHNAAEARAAFDIARGAFDRVSFDLIYARMGQSLADWRLELDEALTMAVDHLSLYQLTLEPGTRFYDLAARGRLHLPEDETAADMYAATGEICAAAGLPLYEISNHARPGAESRHNRVYWRYGDYVGVGPGAHGRLTEGARRSATATLRDPAAWLAAVDRDGHGLESDDPVAPQDQAVEMLMMGLRLVEGVALDRFAALNGAPLDETRIVGLEADGLVARGDGRLRATDAGRPLLNGVLRTLLV